MKRVLFGQKTFLYATLIFLLFTACQKENIQLADSQPNGTVSAERPKAIARSNDLVVQTFTRVISGSPRQYQFVYSPNGSLDSIVVTGMPNYVYRVFYKGSHLDSVILVQDNRIVSTVGDFQYKGSLITAFFYFLPRLIFLSMRHIPFLAFPKKRCGTRRGMTMPIRLSLSLKTYFTYYS